MKTRGEPSLPRRAETWLWTGPAGHLVGGTLDFLQALVSYLRTRRAGGGRSIR